ncbi:MAG: GNAT family N-acetyltransferase [Cyclobacteriaceae bacterium]
MEAIKIQSVTPDLLPALHQAFLQAFADYEITINLNFEQFKKRFLDKLQLNLEMSAIALQGHQVVGFIFSHVGSYGRKLTAYNGGTGVVPEFRGKGLTSRMYDFLLPKFKAKNVEQCLLEAITTNLKALHVYQKIGFHKTKLFRCYSMMPEKYRLLPENLPEVLIFEQKEPDWNLYNQFRDLQPSYLDQNALLRKNLKNETVIEAVNNGYTLGYAVFQKSNGRISQLAVHPEFRKMGIGAWLLTHVYRDSQKKTLSILNIDDEYQPMNAFFKAIGFKNEMNQHEMRMQL